MFSMFLVTGVLFMAPEIAGLLRVKCYRDQCVRGVQYCVEERQRCYSCDDVKQHCGTEDMPLQCDAFCTEITALEQERMQNETIRELIKKHLTELQRGNATIEMLQHDVTTANRSLLETRRSLQLLRAQNNDLRSTLAAKNNTEKTLRNDVRRLEQSNEVLKKQQSNMSYLQTNYTSMAQRQADLETQLQDQKRATGVLSVILGICLCIVIVLCLVICRYRSQNDGHTDIAPETRSLVSDNDTKTTLDLEQADTGVKADVSLGNVAKQDNLSDDSAVFVGSSAESVSLLGSPEDHALDDSNARPKNHHCPRSVSPDPTDDLCNGSGPNQDTRGINPTPDDPSTEIRLAIDKNFSSVYKQAAMPNNEIQTQKA